MKGITTQDDRGVVFYWKNMCIPDTPSAGKRRQTGLSMG